jgi:hypothetical protein
MTGQPSEPLSREELEWYDYRHPNGPAATALHYLARVEELERERDFTASREECPETCCAKVLDEAWCYVSGICQTHGVQVKRKNLARVEELQRENERLREALRAVAQGSWAVGRPEYVDVEGVRRFARDALGSFPARSRIWSEVCAVVEAAEDDPDPLTPMQRGLAALGRRMDEEGL